jgi:predicted nucleic acid-binding protein
LILQELGTTLAKPYFRARLEDAVRDAAIDEIRASAPVVEPPAGILIEALSPADNVVLATAVFGGAGYLVTGDRALLALSEFRDTAVLRAAAGDRAPASRRALCRTVLCTLTCLL